MCRKKFRLNYRLRQKIIFVINLLNDFMIKKSDFSSGKYALMDRINSVKTVEINKYQFLIFLSFFIFFLLLKCFITALLSSFLIVDTMHINRKINNFMNN
jgi:hypothetical protein